MLFLLEKKISRSNYMILKIKTMLKIFINRFHFLKKRFFIDKKIVPHI